MSPLAVSRLVETSIPLAPVARRVEVPQLVLLLVAARDVAAVASGVEAYVAVPPPTSVAGVSPACPLTVIVRGHTPRGAPTRRTAAWEVPRPLVEEGGARLSEKLPADTRDEVPTGETYVLYWLL